MDPAKHDEGHDAPSRSWRKYRNRHSALLLCLLLLAPAWAAAAPAYQVVTVATGLRWPWSVARLPDGRFVVSEREGRLLLLAPDGARSVLEDTPPTLFAGQGGYFDVALHPDFADTGWIYLSYAQGTESDNTLALFRARLADDALHDGKTLLRIAPHKSTPQHYGGRLLFLPDGSLLITTGDGFEHREAAQSPGSELGKVLRVDANGTALPDNPLGTNESSARIWTLGHRNPQGLAYDPVLERVYLHEHGPRGGDEINVLEPGGNYGWPAVTHGVDYSGAYVSPFRSSPYMVDPLWVWDPSIAPSGLAVYDGRRFPRWQGALLIGALVDRELRVLRMLDGEVVEELSVLGELGERIRDVRVFAGDIYLLTDSEDGQLLRLEPDGQR